MNATVTNAGERLTFIQLFKEKDFQVEIPIIQRDFAQGRNTSSEIRGLFLDALHSYLRNDKNVDLDFIYGSLIKEPNRIVRFIPLDGQQRLTTLFLLHWYLANIEGKASEFKAALSNNTNSRFTYETRTSSREFCEALISKTINFDEIYKKTNSLEISTVIKNSPWFYLTWQNDPTIRGMLVVLDDIDKRFRDSSDLYEKLTRKVNPVITFLFLDLDEFKLTDDLYIKMNARGKPLTDFENFKAKFEQLIKNLGLGLEKIYKLPFSKNPVSTLEYFSHKIDTVWADLFWQYQDGKTNLYDTQLMNFFRVVATNHYAIDAPKDIAVQNINTLRETEKDKEGTTIPKRIPFSKYETIGCFSKYYVAHLIKVLDKISDGNGKLNHYLNSTFYYNEEENFQNVIDGIVSYEQAIQYFAYVMYLTTNEDVAGLDEWMRVVHNLSENTIYNSAEEFINSIKSINKLIPNSTKILNYLSNDSNLIDGFLGIQITEERIKAHLILKNEAWKQEILKIESHGYFKGQIGFLLSFSGILDYYTGNKNCNWTKDEDNNYFHLFTNYISKSKAVFDDGGLIDFPDYLWHRALLTKGNYLLQKGNSPRFSFLENSNRDLSWKRLLRDNNGNRRNFVKELFDDINFNIENTEGCLQKIIADSAIEDWRLHIIRNPDMIDYCGQCLIRWESENNIILLGQSQLNHYHVELSTYSFYCNFIKNKIKNYHPFTNDDYYPIKSIDGFPCISLSGFKHNKSDFEINIDYKPDNKTFNLYFFDNNKKNLKDDIIAILTDLKFELSTEGIYFISTSTEIGIKRKLNSICKAFIEFKTQT